MARRSAKRIILDEVTARWIERERAMKEWTDAINAVDENNNMTDIAETLKRKEVNYQKYAAIYAEAERCAEMLGATPYEIWKAEEDGETTWKAMGMK